MHRDLKHLNIFLSDLSEAPKVKIGDFGNSCLLKDDECIKKYAGTLGFMAPEVILDVPCDSKSDIWSLGVILYALIASSLPFSGADRNAKMSSIINEPLSFKKKVWHGVSESCKDVLKLMLEKDQEERISIQ